MERCNFEGILGTSQGDPGITAIYDPTVPGFVAYMSTLDQGSGLHSVVPLHGSKVGMGIQMDWIAGGAAGNPGPLSGFDTSAAVGPYRLKTTAGISGTDGACGAQ